MTADRIRFLREKNAMTQSALAKHLGITRSSVNAWELGISVPSTQYIVELAALFNVSTDYLLGVDRTASLDLSGLTEEDIRLVYQIVDQTKDLENYATLAGGGTCYLREIDENGKLGEPVMTYQNTGAALIFNRLVDPAAVAGVTVNGIVYTAE